MGSLCSTPPDPPPNPLAVDLTHFTLLKVVGKGGFGKVNAIQRRQNNELMALKRMAKCEVIVKDSHIRMVWTERDIMSRLNSPFLVNLVHAFQDPKELFFVMPFMQGGDLRFHLAKLGCLAEHEARFYAAEILLGLEAMHALNIVYRDLKPDNVLLDSEGHLRVSDFGLSVELKEKNGYKIRGNAGTSGYLAPEVCTGEPYGLSCDFWTFGITVYEMIHGRRPFKQWKPTDTTDPVAHMRFGANVSNACQDFISGLLQLNPNKRLGCGKTGWEEVKNHPWFASLDWDAIKRRTDNPPIHPDKDAANCNNSADLADQLMDKDPEDIPVEAQKHFNNFDYKTDYKEFLAQQERDNNLAGLQMSTATDMGPVGSSNGSHINSHMIEDQVKNEPKPTTTTNSSTLAPPTTSPHLTAAPSAKYEVPLSPVNGSASSSPAPSSPVADAKSPESSAPVIPAQNPSPRQQLPPSQGTSSISPRGVIAATSSVPASKDPSPRPNTARQTSKNEISFTRHQIVAAPLVETQ